MLSNYKYILFALVIAIMLAINWQDKLVVKEQKLKAADFTLYNLLSEKVSLKKYAGKYILINFWATWCEPCIHEMPSLERLYRKLGGDNFEILAISIDRGEDSKIKKFVSEYNISFPILRDKEGSVSSDYKVFSIPLTYVIDPNGYIILKTMGTRDWADEQNLTFFTELIKK